MAAADAGPERESELRLAQLASIVDSAHAAIIGKTLDGVITSWNPEAERMYGYSAAEIVGKSISQLMPENTVEMAEILAKIRRGEVVDDYQTVRVARDGREIPVLLTVSPMRDATGAIVGASSIARDVSERMRLNSLYDRTQQISQTGGWEYDVESARLTWTDEVYRIYGLDPALGPPDLDRAIAAYDSESGVLIDSALRELLAEGKPYDLELGLVRADGERIWVRTIGLPIIENGKVVRAEGNIVDITQRRRAEFALRAVNAELARSESRFRSIIENALDLVALLDGAGRFTYVNPSFELALGYGREEIIGVDALALLHPDDAERVATVFVEGIGQEGATAFAEYRYRHKDGTWRMLESSGYSLLVDPDVQGVVVISRDITERRRLERQVEQAQRLEAVGQLAGGVAHDFNNLLTAMTSYCDLADDALGVDADPRLRSSVDGIRSAAARAGEMTRQLLAFSRRQVLELAPIDLNATIAEQARLLERVLGEDVKIRLSLAECLDAVAMDAGQLGQIVMNFAVNARDAMPDGGVLTIETQNVELDRAPTTTGAVSGAFVLLAVSDTGCGMDAPTVERIFEPFFTTKSADRGTGLGLSTVIGIVEQSGGRLSVYSEPGIGTTFKVYMPSVGRAALAKPMVAAGASERPTGTGRILLVEDNDAVRKPVVQLLAELGYAVVEADGPETALRLADGVEIDLLVTDVVMPAMNGRQLAERLLERQSELKVLYMSGYTDDAVIARGVIEQGTAFLQKPFGADRLAQKVAELLA